MDASGVVVDMARAHCRVDGDGMDRSPCRGCEWFAETSPNDDSPAKRGGGCSRGGCDRIERYQAGVVAGALAGRISVNRSGGGGGLRRVGGGAARNRHTGIGASSDIDAQARVLGYSDRYQWAAAECY